MPRHNVSSWQHRELNSSSGRSHVVKVRFLTRVAKTRETDRLLTKGHIPSLASCPRKSTFQPRFDPSEPSLHLYNLHKGALRDILKDSLSRDFSLYSLRSPSSNGSKHGRSRLVQSAQLDGQLQHGMSHRASRLDSDILAQSQSPILSWKSKH